MKYFLSSLVPFLFFCFSCLSQNDTNTVIKLNNQSWNFEKNNQSDSAILMANKALSLSLKIKYNLGVSGAYNNLGNINRHKADYPEALNYYYKGLVIDEAMRNQEGALLKLGNIGIIYYNQNDYNNALKYYERAQKIAKKLNNKKAIANVLANTADVYSSQGKTEAALKYYDNAFKYYKAVNSEKGMSNVLINSGNVYMDKGDSKLALKKYLSALEILEDLKDNKQIASCLLDVAFAYSKLKDNKAAEIFFNKALSYTSEINDLDLKCSLELAISEFYSGKHEFEKALYHFKNHITFRDSVYNKENTRHSVEAEMNYEFDKIQAATKFENGKVVYKLEADNKLHVQQRVFLILFIIVAIALLIFAKRAFDNKKRIAEFMASENNRKEVLLQEVHHRINNNLQIISSLLTLQANSADDEKLHNYLKQSQNRIQSLSALHELLYQNDSPLQIKMNDYLNKVLDFHRDVLNTLPNKVDIKLNITDASFPTKMAVPIALIVNELVTNSIKYAFNDGNNGQINISLLPFEGGIDKWVLHVSDTGKGLPTDTNFRKDSLGLRLVTIMAKQIKGDLIKSNVNGANFDVIFSLTA